MAKNYRVLSATNVLAMSIVLLLSLVTYPFAFSVNASTDPLEDGSTTNLNLNDTGSADPLSDAVLILDDGTNVLNTESASDSAADTASGGADSSLDSTSGTSDSSTSSDDSSSRETSSDSSSLGPTGEVGSSTGEVGSSTGEVLPSDDAAAVEIVPSEDATSATEGGTEPAGNVSTTDEGAASVSNDASTTEHPITSPPSTSESDERGAEVGSADLSSSSSSIDSNANSLATESVTAASAENPNAVVQPVSAGGDPQTVNFGDVANTEVPQWSLDKQGYKPGDTAVLTISDKAANRDPNFPNTVTVLVDGTAMTATEDGPDSGIFKVDFVVKDKGNKLEYDASHPQSQVVINGVNAEGSVQLREIPASSFESTLGQEQPAIFVGNGIELTLLAGANLEFNSDCENIGYPPDIGCGGSTAVTLSYANGPSDLNGVSLGALTIWQFVPGIGWLNLKDYQGLGDIVVDPDAQTVTAISPFGTGVYVIGSNSVGGGGGGGGAVGLPGAGLVLDLVATVVAAESPEPVSESTTSLPDTSILSVEDDAANTTSSVSAITESTKPVVGIGEESGILEISRNGNTTIAVPGEGNVTLSFTNLISEGELTVSAVKDSDLAGFKVVKNAGGPAKVMSVDKIPYSLAGTVFDIGPADIEFNGTITVSVPFKDALVPPGSEVRLLHYTGSGWEDVTTQGDPDVATGSLSSLGAVAPAVKLQTINLVSAAQ